jgi:hypothetical protein
MTRMRPLTPEDGKYQRSGDEADDAARVDRAVGSTPRLAKSKRRLLRFKHRD